MSKGLVIIKVSDTVRLCLLLLSPHCLRTAFPALQRQHLHRCAQHVVCFVANPLCMAASVQAQAHTVHTLTDTLSTKGHSPIGHSASSVTVRWCSDPD